MKTQEHWEEEAKRRLQSLARVEELFANYFGTFEQFIVQAEGKSFTNCFPLLPHHDSSSWWQVQRRSPKCLLLKLYLYLKRVCE